MADSLDALLGLDISEEDNVRALADQLRRKERIEKFFSGSSIPEVAAGGTAGVKHIRDTARRVGDRRYTMGRDTVTDARNVTTDARLDQARKEASAMHGVNIADKRAARDKLDKAETWINDRGDRLNVQRNDYTGEYIDLETGLPHDLVGFRPDPQSRKGRGKEWFAVDINGAPYHKNVYTQELRDALGNIVTDQAVLDAASNKVIDFKADESAAKELAKGEGEWLADEKGASYDRSMSLRNSSNDLKQLVGLIDSGAKTGPINELIFTLNASTKLLETLQTERALNSIKDYGLAPTSDKDIKLATAVAIPTGLTPENLRVWAEYKQETNRRLQSIEDATYAAFSGMSKMPTPEQKTALADEINDIMYGDGFDWTVPLGGEAQETTKPDADGYIYKRGADGVMMRKKVDG